LKAVVRTVITAFSFKEFFDGRVEIAKEFLFCGISAALFSSLFSLFHLSLSERIVYFHDQLGRVNAPRAHQHGQR
jgi:hypothetical protein